MDVIPTDELTATVLSVVASLPQQRKAGLLLEHALALIDGGRCVVLYTHTFTFLSMAYHDADMAAKSRNFLIYT